MRDVPSLEDSGPGRIDCWIAAAACISSRRLCLALISAAISAKARAKLASAPDWFVSSTSIAASYSSRAKADRKSTRLNSSHLGISYAVFCLKKKKNNTKKHREYTTTNTL